MKSHGLAVLLFLALACTAAPAQDFRRVSWGMTPQEVAAAEPELSFTRLNGTAGSILSAAVDVMGHAGVLAYIFENGRLVMAQYRFDDDEQMRTYTEILGVLTDKYGSASREETAHAQWRLDRTFIGLAFAGDICRVSYADQHWIALVKEKERAEYDSYF